MLTALDFGMRAGRAISGHLSGEEGLVDIYAAGLEEHFQNYLDLRSTYYGLERRWSDERFWYTRT
jgi:hypothetical protein